jgi:hypothetical protein
MSGGVPATAVKDGTGSLGMAACAGVLTGLTGAFLAALLALTFPVLPLLVAPIYGRLVADAIISFSGKTRGQAESIIGIGSILFGTFLAFGHPFGLLRAAAGSPSEFAQAMVGLTIGISVVVCHNRLKQRPS